MIRIATLDDETQWLTTERIITEQCFESGDYSFSAYNDVDKFLLELKYKENDLLFIRHGISIRKWNFRAFHWERD